MTKIICGQKYKLFSYYQNIEDTEPKISVSSVSPSGLPPLLLHSLHHLFQQRAERKQHYRRNARHHCKQREKPC